ncbi:MAG TPA: Asd/ArgC dimerization domain-containing protein [Candidatus Acidoferrum sp.]|nr:Asd/ArgC dimerization domain-containing protein [Candidatus Acidoferrum sp.]
MPSFERDSQRIVIAGASTLLGTELKSLLEESPFASWDYRLLDEEVAAGTLTEAGGEPAVILPAEEGSFDRARFVFFTGSAAFTKTNLSAAKQARGKIVDLSGALADHPKIITWFPGIDSLRGGELPRTGTAYVVPSAAATAAATLSLALQPLGLEKLVFVCFQPVSEAGRAGIEELESQTSQVLSFQSVGKPVFDAQVAFALLDRFGPASSQDLLSARERIRTEIEVCIAGKTGLPALQLLHVPVFYGVTFAACAHVTLEANCPRLVQACNSAGFAPITRDEALSNISAAGETLIQLAEPQADPAALGTWWFWGAADNIRVPAWNAVKLAEKLL